ncbi:MAG TPA: hypothetical protein VIJ80_04245 [Candidatus Cryosericum sp.]
MKRRRGVALLTVVLLAALVLAAVAVTSSQVIAEKSIDTSEWGFKKALSVAETGLAVAETDLRSASLTGSGWTIAVPNGRDTYLKPTTDIALIATASSGTVLDTVGPTSIGHYKSFPDDSRSRYSIKVKMLSAGSASGLMKIGLYVLGEVYAGDATQPGAVLLGRRVLYQEVTVTFGKTSQPTNAAFSYGLFSGSSMRFGSSDNPDVRGCDIYARGTLDLGGKDRLDTGKTAYSLGGATGVVATDTAKTVVPGTVLDVPFPQLNVGWYDQMANDFKTGSRYYSGNSVTDAAGNILNANYPNTSLLSMQGYLQQSQFLGAQGTTSTLAGVQNLYLDLQNANGGWMGLMTPGQRTDLLSKLKYAVYHVVTSGNMPNFTSLGATMITGPYNTTTGIWSDTDIKLVAGTNVGNAGGLALLVKGNVVATGGGNESANVEGLLYMTGTFDSGSGHFTVNGAIVSGGSMGATNPGLNGNFQINYEAITDMPNMSIVGGTTTGSLVSAPGTWVEKDLLKFDNAS